MNTKYEFMPHNEDRIAYVRPVAVADLPRDLQDQAGGAQLVYAVHNSIPCKLATVSTSLSPRPERLTSTLWSEFIPAANCIP